MEVSDTLGNVTTYQYDTMGRVMSENVDGVTTMYTYNPSGTPGEEAILASVFMRTNGSDTLNVAVDTTWAPNYISGVNDNNGQNDGADDSMAIMNGPDYTPPAPPLTVGNSQRWCDFYIRNVSRYALDPTKLEFIMENS